MKYIGIITAVYDEQEAIKEIIEIEKTKDIYGLQFIIGKIQDKPCVLVQCGVGKVHAARTTQIMIDNFDLEYVINVGVAGALNYKLNIGDVVIGQEVVQHDFDITAFRHSKGYIPGVGNSIKCSEELLKKFQKDIENINQKAYNIVVGTIASGDIFCTEIPMKEKIYAKFDAHCVEMEAGAIGQVCYLCNIPFIIIRSISDTPNGQNELDYNKFIDIASKRAAGIINEALDKKNDIKLLFE